MSGLYKVAGEIDLQAEPRKARDGSPFPKISSPTEMEKQDAVNKQAWMQQVWTKTMHTKLGIPDRYSQVAVLIICWEDHLDQQSECWKEVEPLHELFKNSFHYDCSVIKLTDQKRPPQAQLDKAIIDFVYYNDGPHRNNLLIVYYTGHGWMKEVDGQEHLIVSGHPREQNETPVGSYPPHADWTIAEGPLDRGHADTLVVLDCCCAGSVVKGRGDHERAYEVMVATGKYTTTAMPGPNSYTNALIQSLRAVLEQEQHLFSTYDIQQMISKRRANSSSGIWNRRLGTTARHIYLTPLTEAAQVQTKQIPRPLGSLNLCIDFEKHSQLSPDEITRIAEYLSDLPTKVNMGICDIKWISFEPHRMKQLVQMMKTVVTATKRFQDNKSKRKRKAQDLVATDPKPKRRQTLPQQLCKTADSPRLSLSALSPLTPSSSSRDGTPGLGHSGGSSK